MTRGDLGSIRGNIKWEGCIELAQQGLCGNREENEIDEEGGDPPTLPGGKRINGLPGYRMGWGDPRAPQTAAGGRRWGTPVPRPGSLGTSVPERRAPRAGCRGSATPENVAPMDIVGDKGGGKGG